MTKATLTKKTFNCGASLTVSGVLSFIIMMKGIADCMQTCFWNS